MSLKTIKNSIRNIPDFPQPGIQFKDITTAIKQPEIFAEILEKTAAEFANCKIDYIIGIESRGFIFGAALAYILKCGFIPARKPGKLPAATLQQQYALEYGFATLEIHKDALKKGAKVLIVDDLLATGGTAEAAAELAAAEGAEIVGFAFIIELSALNGRAKIEPIAPVHALINY